VIIETLSDSKWHERILHHLSLLYHEASDHKGLSKTLMSKCRATLLSSFITLAFILFLFRFSHWRASCTIIFVLEVMVIWNNEYWWKNFVMSVPYFTKILLLDKHERRHVPRFSIMLFESVEDVLVNRMSCKNWVTWIAILVRVYEDSCTRVLFAYINDRKSRYR
jgi:hypothetical protein